jgi:hypothetical protein
MLRLTVDEAESAEDYLALAILSIFTGYMMACVGRFSDAVEVRVER